LTLLINFVSISLKKDILKLGKFLNLLCQAFWCWE